MAGELTLTFGGSNPLSGSGFSFNGSFDLEVNTTGVSQTVMVGTSTTTISGGPNGASSGGSYVEVHAMGNLVFGTATNGFLLNNADFYLSVSSQGLSVSGSATLVVEVGGTQLLSISATAGLMVSSSGLAATLTVSASIADPDGYYYLGGTFQLLVNTTGADVMIGSVTVPGAPFSGAPAGPYFELAVTGAKLMLGTSSSSATTGLDLTGSFNLTIGSTGLALTATAMLNLEVGGTNLFSFTCNGALLITSAGIAAEVDVTIGGGFGGNEFSFSATFVLEVNSTGSAVTTINNAAVNLPKGPYFEIMAAGTLTLGGVVNINGSFTLIVNSSGLEVGLNATLSLFGNLFSVNGFAAIYSSGIALSINLSLGGSGSPVVTIIPGVLSLSGSFNLQVNTTNQGSFTVNGTTYTIPTDTLFNVSVHASFNVFGFSLATITFDISESGGVFSASGQVGFDFFGFITFTVDFYFDSNGNYWFYGHTHVQLGSNSFNIHGDLTLEFASNSEIGAIDTFENPNITIDHNFELAVDGGVTAFGYTFASVGASVTINGDDVSISVYVSISFYFFSIGGTVTIHLGTINPPPTPPPPPMIATVLTGATTIDGQSFGAGTLLLNIGSYATADNRGIGPQAVENYTITFVGAGTTSGTEDVDVYAPGIYANPIEYDNVSTIVAPNAGTSNVTLQIDGAVTGPVVIFAGTGVNQFVTGGGSTVIHGSSGSDTVVGGAGAVTFHAGTGASVFVGGGGGSTNNVIDDPGSVSVVETGYSSYSLVGASATSATLTYDGNTDQLNGAGITVTLKGAATGAETFSVSDYSGMATLDADGNSDVTTSITLDNGNLSLSGNVVTESNGTAGTITLQSIFIDSSNVTHTDAYGSLNLYGGSGNNTLTVNSWTGTGAVTLDGKGGSDTYVINFQSSGSFTADVNDSGTSGTDTLVVNGTAGNNTINLNSSAVSLGSQTVNYSSVEILTVYTKGGNDTVNVTATSANTTINGGNGNDTFNLSSIGNATTVDLGSGTNTVNVGSLAPTETGGTLKGIQALLTVAGVAGGNDTLYLDDSADTSVVAATLTATGLTGVFGSGGSLNYSGIGNFNLQLGNAADTMNVQSLNGTVNLTLGTGPNIINVGSTAGVLPAAPGVVNKIAGVLNLVGGGSDTLNVDDTGSSGPKAGTLTPTSLSGLSMGTSGKINYQGVSTLNIRLGSGGNTFHINNINAGTRTSVNGGSSGDDDVIATFTGDFDGWLGLTAFEHGMVTVTGNFNGTLTDTAPGHLESVQIDESLTATGSLTAGGIDSMTVGHNLAGMLAVTGNLGIVSNNTGGLTVGTTTADSLSGTVMVGNTLTNLTVTGDISGTVTESGTINLLSIGGSLTSTGMITASNSADPTQVPGTTLGNINSFTIGDNLAGKVIVSGNLGSLTVGALPILGTLSGTVSVNNTLTALTVTGDVSGTVTESGTINLLTIGGSLTSTGMITASNSVDPTQVPGTTLGNINTFTIGDNLAGKVIVSGNLGSLTVGSLPVLGTLSGTVSVHNTLTTLVVTGDVSGTVTESGTINLLTIGGSLTSTGIITASNSADPAQVPGTTLGNINTFTIGDNLAGNVIVSGNLGSLTVGLLPILGTLSGSVSVHDTLMTMKVTGDVSGTVTESGTITLLTIGGSLDMTGVITAANTVDPAQVTAPPGTSLGNINTFTIGDNLAGKVIVTGNLVSLTVGMLPVLGTLSGTVSVHNTLTTLVVTGDISGTVTESGTINLLTIGGSLTQTGVIKAVNGVPALGNIVAMSIGLNFAGTLIVSGTLGSLTIVNGSMASTASLSVGALGSMTIGPASLSVGQNMAGQITVLGTFQSLRVAGGTPGSIIVGHMGTIAVYGGFGPIVLNIIENGIQRYVEAATPANPYPATYLPTQDPYPVPTTSTPYINIQFYYESGALANPQLTARITNNVSTAPDQFDLSLMVFSDVAKFNLARLDAGGVSGLRNVDVEGDLLTSVSSQAANFFIIGGTIAKPVLDTTPAGIRLPSDTLAGVGIRDFAPNGYIQAHSIQAVAFGSDRTSAGVLQTGAMANATNAAALLAPGTAIVQAADTFRVPFADLSTQQVALFLATSAGQFNSESVIFEVQSVLTPNAAGTANIVTPSNAARGAVTALVTAMPTFGSKGQLEPSVIQTVALRGDGGSIQTQQWISTSITSTGPLGNLLLQSTQGITNVAAPSIFGSIVSGGGIIGTVQTTGLRTDPITGAISSVNADFGGLYVAFSNNVPYLTTTVVQAQGPGITGQLISRGNLFSQVTSNTGISGVIAIQGNFGLNRTVGGKNVRFGGLLSNGTVTGSIVILGQELGDVRINGGLAGNYAVKGGILGNLLIDGTSGKLVSGGQIGSATEGTAFSLNGGNTGIIAADGNIILLPTGPTGNLFNDVGTSGNANAAAINAIFTNNGAALGLDVNPLDLHGLALILTDMQNLKVTKGVLTGPVP